MDSRQPSGVHRALHRTMVTAALLTLTLAAATGNAYPFDDPRQANAAAEATVSEGTLRSAIRDLLDEPGHRNGVERLYDFYAGRGFEPQWTRSEHRLQRLAVLRGVLDAAGDEGLDTRRYPVAHGYGAARAHDARLLAEADVQASADLVRYVLDLRGLHPDSTAVRHPGATAPELTDAATILSGARQAPDLRAFLAAQVPASAMYRSMRRALAHYHALRAAGGWPQVPTGRGLEPGDDSARIAAVRRRLYATGDLLGTALHSTFYDAELQAAVMRFQARHGLAEDGIIGRRTLGAMRATVDERIDQIAANMERARWLPADLGERHVMVNVPSFELEVVERGERVMHMPIIVGRRYRRTPIFSGELTYLELNPYWNVPESIARRDLLPKLVEDPYYMADTGLRMFDKSTREELFREEIDFENVSPRRALPFRMRQDPGPENALGRVKFLFENPYAVYLHDTPARELFDKTERTFSSGCIRIQRPLEMAEYLLQGKTRWNRDGIDEVLEIGNRRRLRLPQPVKVHLVYRTAWMDDDGRVQFRRDIYGRDRFLVEKLLARRAAGGDADV